MLQEFLDSFLYMKLYLFRFVQRLMLGFKLVCISRQIETNMKYKIYKIFLVPCMSLALAEKKLIVIKKLNKIYVIF